MTTPATVLSVLTVFLSFLPKPGIQSSSEGNLTCESSTIDQYKCTWKFLPRYGNETYEIKSIQNDEYRDEIIPVNISSQPQEYQIVNHFDCTKGRGKLTEQIVSVYKKSSSGKTVLVSNLSFTPYIQAIPNKVTNLKLEVTETYITAMWNRPHDLQDSDRKLLYKLRYGINKSQEIVGRNRRKETEEYLITGLSPQTTYNVSLACRFKLNVFDHEAKWGEETINTVTTLGSTTPPPIMLHVPNESPEWVYAVIGLFIGMVFVMVIIGFIIQIKRRYMILDLKNTTQISSNILKWKDLKYCPVTKEKEQYNILREPQTETSSDSGNVSSNRELQADDGYILKSNDQELYKPISFTNVDRSQPINLPTSTESNALLETYVKIGDGYQDDEDLHITSTTEEKDSTKKSEMNNKLNGYINRDNNTTECGYIPI